MPMLPEMEISPSRHALNTAYNRSTTLLIVRPGYYSMKRMYGVQGYSERHLLVLTCLVNIKVALISNQCLQQKPNANATKTGPGLYRADLNGSCYLNSHSVARDQLAFRSNFLVLATVSLFSQAEILEPPWRVQSLTGGSKRCLESLGLVVRG
ncbi:hypothetical protein FQN52_003806 [Onygenales sp. PD_12]|nr:hypothetical protein FQN52_003806 [Onygenales sp. PD_12]